MVGGRFLFCLKHYHCLIQVYILTMQQHGELRPGFYTHYELNLRPGFRHVKYVSAPLLDMLHYDICPCTTKNRPDNNNVWTLYFQ